MFGTWTSSQTELRLVNVARASLEELLLDYEDYLRHRRLPMWPPNSPQAHEVRHVPRRFKQDQSPTSDHTEMTELTDPQRWSLYARWLDSDDSAVRANATICLIHQANFLLDKQITAIEAQFITEGGYSEQLAAARLAKRTRERDQDKQPDPTDLIPQCPKCGNLMALRTAKQGQHAGSQFWGCSQYPDATALRPSKPR